MNILALTFRLYNTTPWEKNYTSTHALRADVWRTNLVSMTRVSLWLFSILSNERVSLKIIYLVTQIVTIKNWVVSQKPWVIQNSVPDVYVVSIMQY